MPFGIHPGFLLVLLVIVLVIFGPGKLGDIGGAVGRGMREFRKESDKVLNDVKGESAESKPAATAVAAEPVPTSPAAATAPAAETAPTAPVAKEAVKTETEKSA